MKARFIHFGEVRVSGKKYEDDFIIDHGEIRYRDKTRSRKFKQRFDGHTPLSAREYITCDFKYLIIGN
jgi:hypothetical protein